jgi:hypothetical protein
MNPEIGSAIIAQTPLILFIVGIFLAIGLFSRKTATNNTNILDLTAKIKQTQDAEALAKANADQKTQEYLNALKQYDPNFHSNDDGDGTPSA